MEKSEAIRVLMSGGSVPLFGLGWTRPIGLSRPVLKWDDHVRAGVHVGIPLPNWRRMKRMNN